MANWNGVARTNYVRVENIKALRAALEPWPIAMHETKDHLVAFFAETDDGNFPSFTTDENDEEIEFSFADVVMPHIAAGEVLVTMTIGAERKRYLTGVASALVRDGDGNVDFLSFDLNDIYERAAKKFGVAQKSINRAEY